MQRMWCTVGGKAREGPRGNEGTPQGIYTVSVREFQLRGGAMDRMRLSNGRDPNLQMSGFGVITRAIRGTSLVWLGLKAIAIQEIFI